jgi:hypothetical protein
MDPDPLFKQAQREIFLEIRRQLPCYDLRIKTPDSKPFKEIFLSNGLGTVVFTRTVILKGLGHETKGRRLAK